MSEITKENLKQTLDELFEERRIIDAETHRRHHEAIEAWIVAQRKRQERWEKLRDLVIGSVVISFLGGAVTLVGYAVRQWVSHTKGG